MEQEQLLAIVERIAAGEHSEADIEVLRQALGKDEERSLLQLGKYNINIGQGGEGIHIGDRHIEIGGNAPNSVFITGNSNTLTITNENQGLHSPSTEKTDPLLFYVPSLSGSSIFIEREKEIKKIVDILLKQSQSVAKENTSFSPLVGLWGPSGYGKTTLAKMVCHQDSIKESFSGGIFFIESSETLGKEPELNRLCGNVNISCELEVQPATLLKRWNEQPSLIILDNVETKEKLDSLLEINASSLSKWLITTQNKEIFVTHQNYELIEVHSLTKIEIITALKAPFGNEIDVNDEDLRKLADLLYHWPILLGVVLEEIQRLKQDSSDPIFILREVIENIQVSGWRHFDHSNRIEKSLQKALDRLNEEEREHFQSLLIFSSDLDIPFSVMTHIFGLPLQAVKALCSKLYKLALIKSVSREQQVIQTSSFIRKYFLSDSHIKRSLIHINTKFVQYYENTYRLDSPDNLPDAIPSEELRFLNRVYKRHWLREKERETKSS